MKTEFEGEAGRAALYEAMLGQKIVGGHAELARELAARGRVEEVKAGTTLIEQNAQDDDLFLVLSGAFNVAVNGKHVAVCGPGDHVGEMSPMQTVRRRTATVTAAEDSVVLRVPGAHIAEMGEKYPPVWRHMAKELARRLDNRNAKVTKVRQQSRVLIMASPAALDVAKEIGKVLEKDACTVSVWPEGVFRSAKYPIGRLEEELDEADFAVAVAGADEGRENVIFELGFFIGRLGRNRTLLLEPVAEKAEMPSDLTGLITIGYRAGDVAAACERIRAIVKEIGPHR